MPSPFPGMDPYLEGELWQEFHETLAGTIRAQLLAQLPASYVALLAKRYVVGTPTVGILPGLGLNIVDWPAQRVIYPDVHVAALPERHLREPAVGYEAGVAVMAPRFEVVNPLPTVPQLSVEIRDVAQRRLVTVIEILSPANKHGRGVLEYNDRRMRLLNTDTHLLEIDLLRDGTRIFFEVELPPSPYAIYLSRTERRPLTQVWTASLRQRLPAVPVPLLQPDPDVILDLQAAVGACFALVGYERLLDYADPPPPPPLEEEDAAWLDDLLHGAGLR